MTCRMYIGPSNACYNIFHACRYRRCGADTGKVRTLRAPCHFPGTPVEFLVEKYDMEGLEFADE